MLQPVGVTEKKPSWRSVRTKYPSSMPRMGWHCKNVLGLIWPLVGTSEFTYKYIQDTINQGPGILKKMNNTGIVLSTGKAMATGNTLKWVLAPAVIEWLRYNIGPESKDAEEKCRGFNADMYQTSLDIYRNKWTRQKRNNWQEGYDEYQVLACRIWSDFETGPFTFADLTNAGYEITVSYTAQKMRKYGFIEPVGKRKDLILYQLVESAVRGK